ncbi:MAG: B12-binding domain-containing radical SAM protein [Fusobacteria bacterium]|nr:B12-binding domain-containing radical SAM protein [Fusobacteriota bacterium]
MKKILLVALNSKYVHINIALRYIKKYYDKYKITNYNVKILEMTINNSIDDILDKIYTEKSDIVMFSTYVWNIEYVMKISKELKKIDNNIKIGLGGPEVSYNGNELLNNNSFIDYIFVGEGEKIFLNFLENDYNQIKGLFYRKDDKICFNGYEELISNLDEVPFPYDDIDFFNNQIIYYESTRGCPFSCSYCMSSIDKTVRSFSLDRIKNDLKLFIDKKIKLVKFVDRTYNLNKKHYFSIWKFLIDNYTGETKFHFEISGDLFDEEVILFLKNIPNDYFQFEIGVQTINVNTLEAINRKTDLTKLKENINKIDENIHLHLDLIAGLPYEDYNSFGKSFNFVHSMNPDMIQLGFLKILKGTKISTETTKFGYKYRDYPPYEIISNNFITYEEILQLKKIENLVDNYYNSHKFNITLNYIINVLYSENYFKFYEEFSTYWDENSYYDIGHKPIKYFDYVYEYFIDKKEINNEILLECLKFDYLKIGKTGFFPEWMERNSNKDIYESVIFGMNFSSRREAFKNTEFEIFKYNILNKNYDKIETKVLFNYETKESKIIT